MNQYGIDINTLENFIARPMAAPFGGGTRTPLLTDAAFRLERIELKAGSATFRTNDFETTVWVEEGATTVEKIPLNAHESIAIPARTTWSAQTDVSAVLYAFSGPPNAKGEYLKKSGSFDFRDKYWGTIESLVSKDYAGKRMLVKKSGSASLEYHCRKLEGYYIHSGKLLLRLRAGRGEDRFFELAAGQSVVIPPGLMHQRGGLEDTVIIEISTRDEDSDSFLVEDGQKIPMPNLPPK